jgi:hypothetical protein
MNPGDVLEYERILTALETDDKAKVYRCVQRANRQLWAEHDRALAVVRGKGYRMLRADEHEMLAGGYQKQAKRRMNNAVAVMNATRLDELTPDQRDWAIKVQTGLRILAGAVDMQARKLSKHDDLIASLQRRVERLEGA